MEDIKYHLTSVPHNLEWVEEYLTFIQEAATPKTRYDRHHILMQSVFPQFSNLSKHPWNQRNLSYADHLIAHYLLRKAIPCSATATAFRFMVGLRYDELVASNYDSELMTDIAADFELARLEMESGSKGKVKIYRDDEITLCFPDELPMAEADGWSTTYPEQQWIFKGEEERRVLKTDLPGLLLDGWEVGRTMRWSDEARAGWSEKVRENHARRASEPDAYSYMPRGDNHHRRILGISEETKRKIAASLTGRTLSPEHVEARRKSMTGLHWSWSPESRQARSESMRGELHPNWGGTSGMKGKTQSEATRAQMSASQKQRYLDDPEAANLYKPRGEAHFAFGQARPESTRSKISQSLIGRKHSEETKLLRSRSIALKRFGVISQEQSDLLHQYVRANKEDRKALYPRIRGFPRLIAQGLNHILDNTWEATPAKRWRSARVWLYCKSDFTQSSLETRFPALTILEKKNTYKATP